MNSKLLFFSIAIFLFSKGISQKVWTLDECVAYAIENNLQLNDFEFNIQSNKESYNQSIRELLPSIEASTNYVINFGRSTDPFTNDVVTTDFFSNSYNVNSSMDLFQGFQKWNTIKANKLLYQATKEEAQQQKYLLAFRVLRAFYDIQFLEGLVSISKEQVAVSQSNFNLVKKRIDLGLMAGADLYEAKSLLLTDELNLTQVENRLITAKLQLTQEMNLENENNIVIQPVVQKETKETYAVQSDSIFASTETFLPILKAQELRAKATKKQLAAARGRLAPSISLFGGIGTGYFETTTQNVIIGNDTIRETVPFRDQFRDNTFQFIGAQMNFPIFNQWAGRSQVKQQKIEHLRAKNNLNVRRQEVYQTIQQLVQEFNALSAEFKQSQQNEQAQQLAFTIAQKRYEKGLINAIELFTAKNLFANAQNENLQVRLRIEVNKSTLDFYSGLPIFNIN